MKNIGKIWIVGIWQVFYIFFTVLSHNSFRIIIWGQILIVGTLLSTVYKNDWFKCMVYTSSAEPLNLGFVVEYVGVPIETKAYASVWWTWSLILYKSSTYGMS